MVLELIRNMKARTTDHDRCLNKNILKLHKRNAQYQSLNSPKFSEHKDLHLLVLYELYHEIKSCLQFFHIEIPNEDKFFPAGWSLHH